MSTQISLGCPHAENLGPHGEDWSDWVDAQADLRLRWAHRSFCWFYHASAQVWSQLIPVGRKVQLVALQIYRDKLFPIILNYAVFKHLTCQDFF